MANKTSFKYFDTKIDNAQGTEEIIDMLLSLKPNWTKDDLCHEEYTGGYVNSMTCFYQGADEHRADALVVRVYGFEGQELPWGRSNEFLTMQVAQAAGCFPAIVAVFKNGVIYEYEPGRMVTFQDLVKPEIVKKVAHQLYRFQHIDVDSLELVDRRGKPCKYDKSLKTVEYVLKMIKDIPSSPKSERNKEKFEKYRKELTDEYLMREYEFLKSIHDDVALPIALNHSDFHPRNMIINDETGKLTFVDYEITSFNYEVHDLVRFFDNKEFYDQYGLSKPDDPEITEEIRAMYLGEYLTAKHEEEGRMGTGVTNEEVEILETQIRIVKVFNLLNLLVILLATADMSFKGIHFLDALDEFKAKYEAMKNDLPALRDRYLKLVG